MDTGLGSQNDVPPFDPRDPGFRRDPYATYRRMREHAPICFLPDFGMWFATRYRLCGALVKDHRFGRDAKRVITHLQGPDAMKEPVFHYLSLTMLMRDPPDHTRLRGLVTRAFTARRIEAMRPRIQTIAETLLDQLAPRGTMDVIGDFAHPLPVTVICDMLGIPPADRGRFLSGALINPRVIDPVRLARDEVDQENARLLDGKDYFAHLFDQRRRDPGDDLITALLHAEDDEGRLTAEEVFANVWLLLIAGHETTRNLIGNGLVALHRNPGELQRLRDRPDLMANAVEELLRYDSPVQMDGRTALEDVEIEGVAVPKGGMITLMLGSANRDPEQFADPDRLDIGRPGVHGLSFGGGLHFCLGAQLARIEGEIALSVLLRRLPDLELDDLEEPVWKPSITIRGLQSLAAHWS